MDKMTIRDIDVTGKRVFVRVDFNVPMDKSGKITNDTRIREALLTINYLREKGAKVILASHLGRPKGKVNPEFSLAPAALRLSELLGAEVLMAPACTGPEVENMVAKLKAGDVLMLENVRFHAEEETNDPVFAEQLARLADIFVSDAFGTAHRAHASTAGIAAYLPAVAGFLMEKEIKILGKVLASPERPFVAIIGGAKVSDKIGVIENLLTKVDTLIIGGGMANTFLKAKGFTVGKSLVEEDKIELAIRLMEKARRRGVALLLPVDLVAAERFAEDSFFTIVAADKVPDEWMALDIGPETVNVYKNAVKGARTILWNGPMGVFEFDNFANGTNGVARAVAEAGGISVVGGGDSIAAIEKAGLAGWIDHMSTGGGASLAFLEGQELKGISVLQDRKPPMRKPLLAANWKMYKTAAQAAAFVDAFLPLIQGALDREVVICPPFTALGTVQQHLVHTGVKMGAQNMHWEDQGAFTGEISPVLLKDAGCQYVILGHSERRQYCGEHNEIINKKVKAALSNQLLPIFCVGETLAEREAGQTEAVVEAQVREGLHEIDARKASELVVAYEPVWAIGTGRSATADDANQVIRFIRGILADMFGSAAGAIRILYGGSVKPENIDELMNQSDIDGALVGGASLDVASFAKIVKY